MNPRSWLTSLEFHGVKLGLENITLLLEALGNPQVDLRILHIAGTNGKGSVAAFTDSILRAAGYSTGRFTSPHLIRVNERFLINSKPVDDDSLDRILDRIRDVSNDMPRCPTYFEVTTAVALVAFAEAKVDAAILETGLGGRYDATNATTPIATAITSIAMDHMQYLGDTIEKIAAEKAGIIKAGVPVSVAPNSDEALRVIETRAREVGAPMRQSESIESLQLGLAGPYQRENAALAVAMIESVADAYPRVDAAAIERGLAEATWPCRMEVVLESPRVIIDVAHNPAGALALAEAIEPSVIVMAVSDDKDARAMVEALKPKAKSFIATQYDGRRAMSADALAEVMGENIHQVASTVDDAIRLAIETGDSVVIAGSVFLAGQAREILERDYDARPMRF